MPPISVAQLQAFLITACKVVDIVSTFLLADRLNLLSDSCLQSSSSEWLTLVDVLE